MAVLVGHGRTVGLLFRRVGVGLPPPSIPYFEAIIPALEDASMTLCRRALVLSLVLAGLSIPRPAAGQSVEEYQKRRQAVRAKMEPQSVLILRGAAARGEGGFRQENNLYYLTGLNEPGVSLVLFPEPAAAGVADPQQAPAAPASEPQGLLVRAIPRPRLAAHS
jgi:hypothetical protein